MTNTSNPQLRQQATRPQQQTNNTLLNRMGARVTWEMLTLTDTVIQFDLHALGKPLYDLIGIEMPNEVTDAESAITALENDRGLHDSLKAKLDEHWETYQLRGAIFVYNWREEVKQALNYRLLALQESANFVRALEPLLVLNVLARSRASLLLATAPLALERPFLTRTLGADDPRLLKLVSEGEHSELPLVEPPPEVPAEEKAAE